MQATLDDYPAQDDDDESGSELKLCPFCPLEVPAEGLPAHLGSDECDPSAGESDPLANSRPTPGFEEQPGDGSLADVLGEPESEEVH